MICILVVVKDTGFFFLLACFALIFLSCCRDKRTVYIQTRGLGGHFETSSFNSTDSFSVNSSGTKQFILCTVEPHVILLDHDGHSSVDKV